MAKPLLSVVIPTCGRPTLVRLLRALRHQAPARAVEILVVGDTLGDTWRAALAPVPALCRQYQARYLPHAGREHAWGHPQREAGARAARGAWLWWLQDDDLPTPDAVAAIQASVMDGSPGPRLFRTDTWQAGVVWQRPEVAYGNVDADCLVVPRDPARLPAWPPVYGGDYHAILHAVAQWDGAVRWEPTLVALGRPDEAQDWTQAL